MDSFARQHQGRRSSRRSTSTLGRSSGDGVDRSSTAAVSRRSSQSYSSRRRTEGEQWPGTSDSDRKYFTQCVEKIQRQLKPTANSMNTLHTLASEYTRTRPVINGRPFCVSLSYATFLFHIQMTRVVLDDVLRYVELVATALSQIPENAQPSHPFVRQVVRGDIFGLPSPQYVGPAHYVVLVPPAQYRAFSFLAVELVVRGVVPFDIVDQWHHNLRRFARVPSPMVRYRSQAILLRTLDDVDIKGELDLLRDILNGKPSKLNVDFILTCYERLKRVVPCVESGPMYGRALSILSSDLFLGFRSPIRRDFVERFLYPSLCGDDMSPWIKVPRIRTHLYRELLRLCTPGMSASNPYYLCLCAILRDSFVDPTGGAVEVVSLVKCLMPHAAYFIGTLAIDPRMPVPSLAKVVMSLTRGSVIAMKGHMVDNDVSAMLQSPRSVYSVLFALRETVRSCCITSSQRAEEMLFALRVAVPPKSVEMLGKTAQVAFEEYLQNHHLGSRIPSDRDHGDSAVVDPQLLCAELAMVLHQEHIDDAIETVLAHLRDMSSVCIFCCKSRGSSLICEVNQTIHVWDRLSVGRMLATLSECAGMNSVQEKLICLLRDPSTQLDSAVHFLVFHILSHAGAHRNELFVKLEPYIRGTLTTLKSADMASTVGLASSEQRASTLMLHVKIVILMANTVEPSYIESILCAFCELRLRNNHDALAMWYLANLLLRQGRTSVELLPIDPAENNYCMNHPNCAPESNKAADNAQLLLRLIDRSHSYSSQMRKLVGCCVCKLIQDFNMQIHNIVTTLLSPFGFVPVSLDSLLDFALPVGSSSAFWSFFLRQMKTSSPARAAFAISLVKCIAHRFRISSPATVVPLSAEETTSHLFAVMTYEAVKRSPALARVVLHLLAHWVRMLHHKPGGFASLVYSTTQLMMVVFHRGTGASGVELQIETQNDARQFDEAVAKAAHALKSQVGRIAKLGTVVREQNVEFYYLLRRLYKRVSRVVLETVGEQCNDGAEILEQDDTDGFHEENEDGDVVELLNEIPSTNAHEFTNGMAAYSLELLQQPSDDAVFDESFEYDDVNDVALPAPVPLEQQRVLQEAEQPHAHVSEPLLSHRSEINVVPSKQDQSTMTSPNSIALSSRRGTRDVTPADVEQDNETSEVANTQGSANSHPARGAQKSSQGTQHGSSERQTRTASSTSNAGERLRIGSGAPAAGRPRAEGNVLAGVQEISSMFDVISAAVGHTGESSTWHEPEVEVCEGDEVPIEDNSLPALQGTRAFVDGVAVPSGLVLQYLYTCQNAGPILNELQQFEEQMMNSRGQTGQPMQQRALAFSGGAGGDSDVSGTNQGHPQHQISSVSPVSASHTVVLPVTVEGRANNYSEPHFPQAQQSSKVVMAQVNMVNTVERRAAGEGNAVSGSGSQPAPGKRNRAEETVSLPSSWHQNGGPPRGMKPYGGPLGPGARLLSQQSASAVVQELGDIRGQGAMAVASATSEVTDVADERSRVTPYSQLILPQFFVEQNNDTAVRELRQVMGMQDPNDGRLSMNGKRKIRGSGGPVGGDNSEGNGDGRTTWWSETSATPVPQYATDPQYSMELP
uniref:Kinetoplastid kinetochore protein 1 n=1 Tax=Trypanosoma congolense (strain IL3000) TaxID=1068625 RepID=G0UWK8_TRYCI|nr:conserved hypothetical protein [Trypanosoma congolense IL3000]